MGRQALNRQGYCPALPEHRDGSRWVYWAEEVEIKELASEADEGGKERSS